MDRPQHSTPPAGAGTIATRLDSLRWGPFHSRVLLALGITWVLDGLEVTLAGALSGALQASPVLALSDAQVGQSASAYLAGAVLGARGFGWATDRLGLKRLFFVTLGVYLLGTAASAFANGFEMFALCRFVTGAGIGGEYAAINSAIQELIPAHYRGRTDLGLNGSFWLGAGLGALGAMVLLAPGLLPPDLGWRLAFGIGAVLGVGILWLRRLIPESPRWLASRGRMREADAVMTRIERESHGADAAQAMAMPAAMGKATAAKTVTAAAPTDLDAAEIPAHAGLGEVMRTLVLVYPRRTAVGLVLMAAQAFCYNAVFFTYALVLGKFFGVPPDRVGLWLLPMAVGNFLGPLVLGRFFDTLGRRVMIPLTYAMSGVLLLVTAWLFAQGVLNLVGQAIVWSAVFFFASAAASAAYLTVGETFPLEIRALAIALFYAFGTALGGVGGPWLFGELIGTGQRTSIAWGYAFGAVLMLVAAFVHRRWGIAAERRGLEEIAGPLRAQRISPSK